MDRSKELFDGLPSIGHCYARERAVHGGEQLDLQLKGRVPAPGAPQRGSGRVTAPLSRQIPALNPQQPAKGNALVKPVSLGLRQFAVGGHFPSGTRPARGDWQTKLLLVDFRPFPRSPPVSPGTSGQIAGRSRRRNHVPLLLPLLPAPNDFPYIRRRRLRTGRRRPGGLAGRWSRPFKAIAGGYWESQRSRVSGYAGGDPWSGPRFRMGSGPASRGTWRPTVPRRRQARWLGRPLPVGPQPGLRRYRRAEGGVASGSDPHCSQRPRRRRAQWLTSLTG